jgi:hypothetical protein
MPRNSTESLTNIDCKSNIFKSVQVTTTTGLFLY